MHMNIGKHVADDVLEGYFMHRLTEAEIASVEEHLLVCDRCQDRAEQTESFVLAAKGALVDPGRKPAAQATHARSSRIRYAWLAVPVLGAALAVLTLAVYLPLRHSPGRLVSTQVKLYAMRGSETAPAQVRSGSQLTLDLSAADISAAAGLEVHIVDSAGRQVWAGAPLKTGADLRCRVTQILPSGQYWVRLLRGQELIHEYGIRIG